MCHIIGIEPQFKNIIENGPFIPMIAGQRKPEGQWSGDERKAANLDQRLKSHYKPELRPNKDFEAKYNKVNAKLALLSFGTSSKSSIVKNKRLVAEAYVWDKEDVSSDDNEMTEVKVLMALADDENVAVGKESARNDEWVKITMRKVHTLVDIEDNDERKSFLDYLCIDLNYVEEQRNNLVILLFESQVNTIDPPVAVTDSSATEYDFADESSVCSTPLPLLEKLTGVAINKPFSAPAKAKASTSKTNSTPTSKLKNVKTEDDFPLANVMKDLSDLKLQISKNQSSYSRNNKSQQCERTDHRTCDHAEYMSTINMSQHLKSQGGSSSRSRTSRPSKHFFPPCIHCGFNDHLSDDYVNYPICDIYGSYNHDTHGHNKSDIRKPIWYLESGCSRHMTGVKSYLHKYVEQPGPKVVFGDDSTCITEGYSSIKCNGIFDEKRGTIFNSNKEIVMIAPRSDIRKPIWYLESGCSRHMTGVKSYLHKYVEQPGPKLVFEDDSTCITEGYGSIKCNGIVFIKVAFVNGLKYNLLSISQLCDAKYIVQFDEKRGTIFNSNKEIVMIAPRDKPCSSCEKGKHHRASFKTKQTSFINKCLRLLHMELFGLVTHRSINHEKYTLVIVDEYSRSTIVKRHLKTPYEIFRGRIPNIDFLNVFGYPVYIHNHKDCLGKFGEKADDGYFLGYSLVSKAFRVFNTKRQQTEETCHITFDESTDAIKFTKSSDDNITIAESERYPPDKYLHPYEPSQWYQVNRNVVYFIDLYERPEPVVIEIDVSSDQHDQHDQADQNDQNDHSVQNDEILNDDQSKNSNHNNDNHIIDNLPNTEDVPTSKPLSSPAEDASVSNTVPISTNPSLSIPSMV
ncbi:retrovirus-related pol polyprotein from transposon TNT 1-94 [Tanacetum coccineum]